MRLNKYISQALGISRRAADDLIAAGHIKIDASTARLGQRVEDGQVVRYKGHRIKYEEFKPTYILLNKPTGYLSSKKSQGGAPTIYQLLPKHYLKMNLNIAGRLDKDSRGLIVLTNDGTYLNQLAHPGQNKIKRYIVTLNKNLDDRDLTKLKKGVQIGDSRPSKFQEITLLEPDLVEVTLSEGRNRQIRRTFQALGYDVTDLYRIQIADHNIGTLSSGQFQEITEKD